MAKAILRQTDTMPDGSIIDLDSYDWGEEKLTRKEKLLVVWYTTPNQEGYKSPTKAALKAGYTKKSAYHAKEKLITRPRIKKLIAGLEKDARHTLIVDAAQRFQIEAIERAEYDLADYVETSEWTDKDGNKHKRMQFKDIENIPEEKRRIIIGGLEFNNSGEPMFELPDKEAARKAVIQMAKDFTGDNSADSFDVETTLGLIKENIAVVKTTVRKRNQEIRENSGEYIENAENLPDFD